ncbi:LOW QUALITY PROTEIN: EEF1A lysine methyltransferase 3-like [Spinachia spinachia]
MYVWEYKLQPALFIAQCRLINHSTQLFTLNLTGYFSQAPCGRHHVFAETCSQDTSLTLFGQDIQQDLGANFCVAVAVWDAELHLCSYLEWAVQVRGRRVIELAAGTGVVALVCTPRCAVVTLTDLPLTVSQLQANVSANMASSGPTVLPLSWGEDHIYVPFDWDLVLCADVVYLPETYPLLVKTLAHLCKNRAVLYLAFKMRKEHDFFEECLPGRFNVDLVHRYDGQNIHIYRASLKKDQ